MSPPYAQLAVNIAGRADAMLDQIERLVSINSYTGNKAGGDRVGGLLSESFAALGLSCERVASRAYADHLVFKTARAAADSSGAVVLVGHHDTVFPPGSFEGFSRDARLARGPGVLDMKGGLVVMLEALRAIKGAGGLDDLPLVAVIVGDEEVGSSEGRPVIQAHARGAKAALVFEAGRAADKIITCRKGTGGAKVVATGRAAHAANGHKDGINAIWALARFIDRAQAITDYSRGITINVGVVTGGEAKNTVPDRAECQIDFRYQTIADAEATLAAMRRAAEEAAASLPGAQLELSVGSQRMPLERTPENVALCSAYAAHARAVGLGGDEAALIAGGSDASSTSALGVPSIDGLGPRGSGFHTKDELIEIASLEPKALALARYLWDQRVASGPSSASG